MRLISDEQEDELILLYLTLKGVRKHMLSGRYVPIEGMSPQQITANLCTTVIDGMEKIFPEYGDMDLSEGVLKKNNPNEICN
jgi:hypothetical protein